MNSLSRRLPALFILILVSITVAFAGEKPRVIIFDFTPKGVEPVLAESVTESFITALIQQKRFTFVERSELNKIYKELSLQFSDDFNESQALNVGRIAGAELILLGNVTRIGENYTINVRGVDIETGEARFARMVTVDDVDDLLYVVQDLVDEIGRVNLEAVIYKGPCEREALQLRYLGERWGDIYRIPDNCELPRLSEKEHFKIESVKRFRRSYYTASGENVYEVYDEEMGDNHAIIWLKGTLQDCYIKEHDDEEGYDIFLVENDKKVHSIRW